MVSKETYWSERQQKRIRQLEEQVEVYERLIQANNAIMAAILKKIGADEENPVEVSREEISGAMEQGDVMMSRLTDDNRVHRIFWK